MKRLTPLVLVVLLSCGTNWHLMFPGKPDLVAPDGPSVYFDGSPPIPDVLSRIARVRMVALSICPLPSLPTLDAHWRVTRIHVVDHDPFDCYGYQVHGCQTDLTEILIGSKNVLNDELGHVVFEACFQRTGEHWVGTHAVYDPDFAAFVAATQ